MGEKAHLRAMTALWALGIAAGSAIRGHKIGKAIGTVGYTHIAAHFGVFFVLGCLLMFSFDLPRTRAFAVSAGVVLGYATELYEHLAFGWPMEYNDVLVDTIGVLAGAALLLLHLRTLIPCRFSKRER
jgi:hypothetical protein